MKSGGFTLIELMIVVSMIGILSAVAAPKFAMIMRRTQEATTKSNLAMLRTAISLYMTAHEGAYPTDDLTSLVTQNYINKIPYERTPPYHPGGYVVGAGNMASQGANTGNWYYFNVQGEWKYGQVIVNCNHTDLKGNTWDQN